MPLVTPALRSPFNTKTIPSDDKLCKLERRLATSSARAAHLQRRLHLTLDALDAVQRTHESELDAATRAHKDLKRLYSQQVQMTKTVESERDQLRNVTTAWIAQNDLVKAYTSCRVKLLNPLDTPSRTSASSKRYSSHSCSPTQTVLLCHQFEQHRSTNTHTLQEMDPTISALEARLSLLAPYRLSRRKAPHLRRSEDNSAVLHEALAVNEALQRDNEALLREVDRLQTVSPKVVGSVHTRSVFPTDTPQAVMSASPPLAEVGHLRQLTFPHVEASNPAPLSVHHGKTCLLDKHIRELQTEHDRLREVISAIDELYETDTERLQVSRQGQSRQDCLLPPRAAVHLVVDVCASRATLLQKATSELVTMPPPTVKAGSEQMSMEIASPLPIPFHGDESHSDDPSSNYDENGERAMDFASPLYEATILPSSSSEMDDEEAPLYSSRSSSLAGTASPTITRSPSMTLIPQLGVPGGLFLTNPSQVDDLAKPKWW